MKFTLGVNFTDKDLQNSISVSEQTWILLSSRTENVISDTVKSPLEAAASNIFGGVFAAASIQVRLEFEGGQ